MNVIRYVNGEKVGDEFSFDITIKDDAILYLSEFLTCDSCDKIDENNEKI